MSKRFKSQASSSRAASGGGLGGFGSLSAGSSLSYLTEPPNLSTINDPNVVVAFKNLSKKDGTTKSKALEDLRTYVLSPSSQAGGGVEDAVLDAWVSFYPRISIDNSRRVRELSHNLQCELLKSVRKRMDKHLTKIVGSWLAGTYDRDRAVSKAAKEGLASFLDTEAKMLLFWKRCQPQILEYAQEAIKETPQTLSDERTMSSDDVQAKYFRVIGSSISLVVNLLAKLNQDDISKYQDKYEMLLGENKDLWSLATCEDSVVRKSIDSLLIICLEKQTNIVDSNLELVSNIFIAKALRSSQSSSAFQLVQCLQRLTSKYPQAWTSSYKGKKAPLSSLCYFIAKGSQGGPPEFWPSLCLLVQTLPNDVLPPDLNKSVELLNSFRDGISNREEPRNNVLVAWSSYLDIAKYLISRFSDTSINDNGLGSFVRDTVFPLFEQYLHPNLENSKWSIGNSTAALAKAYNICAASTAPELEKLFKEEWKRLGTEFISRILSSLPEQSKGYDASQASVITEAHRWFKLVAEITISPNLRDIVHPIVTESNKIFTAALTLLVNRNGKPYGAAATVEAAMRFAPATLRDSSNLKTLKSFFENHIPTLILSPSSTYLISMLNQFHAISSEEAVFKASWEATIDNLLPIENEAQKSKIIAGLIGNHSVSNLAQDNSVLQDFLFNASLKALHGDTASWILFENAITFGSLTDVTTKKVLDQVLNSLDASNPQVESAFQAVEFIAKARLNIFNRDSSFQVLLITKLLALTEISDSKLTSRANAIRAIIEGKDNTLSGSYPQSAPVLQIVRENIETASPQSLSIATLVEQSLKFMKDSKDSESNISLFPDTTRWSETLAPLLEQRLDTELGVMRPFAGAVFLVQTSSSEHLSIDATDINGFSIPLRMAMYTAGLSVSPDYTAFLPQHLQLEILYLLSLTSELVNDQIDLAREDGLFSVHLDSDVINEVRNFIKDVRDSLDKTAANAGGWLKDVAKENEKSGGYDRTQTIQNLIERLIEVSGTKTATAYYAAKVLSRLVETLSSNLGWDKENGEEWLTQVGIMKSSTTNVLGATAILVGLQDSLRTSKTVNNLCNRLIGDIASASAKSEKTLGQLVLLNASLAVYDKDDLPVAQNRLVFAVKQILSWGNNPEDMSSYPLISEACRTLQVLLPAIKTVYGSYWESSLDLCASLWKADEHGSLSGTRLAVVGMSLKLFSVLQSLKDATDDLEDALVDKSSDISNGLVNLLHLHRDKENLPLEYLDDLLLRQVVSIRLDQIDDISTFYPLVASEFRKVQSAAFDILRKALLEAQQKLSVEVLLENTDAKLPEELLSLLLDAPSINDFPDDVLEEFPSPIRCYLFSWHLVLTSFTTASFKVRNDYNAALKAGDYIGPFLTFIFDVLGHSAGNPLSLEKTRLDESMIRAYDMWQGTDSESKERDMHWLLVNLYYMSLKYIPNLVKTWWVDCKSKQTRLAVQSWTERYFSPLLIQDALDDVLKWSTEQETTSEEEKELIVKVSRSSRELFAGYEIDDMMMQIVIRLPSGFPLEGVKVEGVNRVAVSEKKWTSWLMITQGVITFSNGSIIDGLSTFRKNVTGALKGNVECAICYSIISSSKKMPDKRCQTCKNLFHGDCLFKWFKSSNQSTCPLCRNPFGYDGDGRR